MIEQNSMDLRECRVAERFCEVDSVNFSAQRTGERLDGQTVVRHCHRSPQEFA